MINYLHYLHYYIDNVLFLNLFFVIFFEKELYKFNKYINLYYIYNIFDYIF